MYIQAFKIFFVLDLNSNLIKETLLMTRIALSFTQHI